MIKHVVSLSVLAATLLMNTNLNAETIKASDARISLMGRAQPLDDGGLRFEIGRASCRERV